MNTVPSTVQQKQEFSRNTGFAQRSNATSGLNGTSGTTGTSGTSGTIAGALVGVGSGVSPTNNSQVASSPTRLILGGAGGHGLYNTGQSQCNWGNSTGAIGAGYDPCGTFPNDLVWGTGTASPFYDNRSGTWSHWITWS